METANRKLIRPNLNGAKEQIVSRRVQKPKTTPPDQTHAESFYYLKQMQTKTTMVVVLTDGETLHGVIEWYDKFCLKTHPGRRPQPAALQAQYQVHVQGEPVTVRSAEPHHPRERLFSARRWVLLSPASS